MADIKKTIEIVFGAVDNTGQGLSSVASGVRDFADNISGITGPLSDLGDFALKAEASIVALGAAMISFSVNEASKFQAAQNEIGTLLGQNSTQANAYGKDILAYAATSTQAIDQITAATYSAISAGAAQADALGVVNTAEKLSVAGKAELNATTVALVSTLNAYGASASEASRYSDVLFTTVRLGQTTIPELAASLAQVTGIAGSAGVPIETLGAAIAALTASGLPTAQSITGIKAAISGIIQPSKEASDMAAELGIQFNAAALKSKGFDGVMTDIARATGGNVEKISSLFGSVEALNAVLSLTSSDGAKFTAALAAMQSAAGATDAAFRLMSSNGVLAFQNLQNNLRISLITAGMPILEQFGGSVTGLSNVFRSLTFSIDQGAFAPLYAALGEASAGLERFLNGIARALPQALASVDFTGLADSFGDIGRALGGVFGDLDLTKPEDLAKAIQFAVDSIESLNDVVEGIVTAWGPALQTIIAAVAEFNSLSEQSKIATGETLGFAQVFEKVLSPIIGGVTGAVEGLGNAMTALAGVMGAQLAVTTIPRLAYAFGSLIGVLGQAGLVGAAGAAGYAVGTALNEPLNKLASSLAGYETTLGSWIYDLVHGAEEAENFGAATGEAARGVKVLGDATANAKSGTEKMAEGLDGIAGAVSKVTDGPFVDYLDSLGNIVKRTTESGQSLEDWNAAILKSGGVVETAGAGVDKLGNEINAARLIIDAATGAIIGYYGAFEDLSKADQEALKDQQAFGIAVKDTKTKVDETAKAMKEAEEKTRAWNLEMAKLKSNETIALIAQQTAVATETIKANAATMVAAFESVSESIASTNALIGDLYGKENPNDRFGFQQRALLESAEKRANELTKAQIEMLKAQAELMKAQAASAKDGGAVMKIEADGLEPHLEAFMWEILKAVQLRVNRDGMGMLLGVS